MMRFLKGIFTFLLIIGLNSCSKDEPGLEQYYENRDAGIAFLKDNEDKEGVIVKDSGLQYEVITDGLGESISNTDIVKIKYKSTLIDGTILYSNQTFENEELGYKEVNTLLLGLIEGLQYMNVGSHYKFYIPYELAYGEAENLNFIDPFSVIIMEVELIENSFRLITGSGLRYDIIEEGTGDTPLSSDKVKVHYEGSFLNSVVFDSSNKAESPPEFFVNRLIDGWVEGLQLMNEGSKYRFFVPYYLAYGSTGTEDIPPYAPLIFELELIEILD